MIVPAAKNSRRRKKASTDEHIGVRRARASTPRRTSWSDGHTGGTSSRSDAVEHGLGPGHPATSCSDHAATVAHPLVRAPPTQPRRRGSDAEFGRARETDLVARLEQLLQGGGA